ncbi:substance-P receptor [Caerostris darwini]|uniref:Substance-P receptor n=1 Tax=Caerostris darwini TaxID=1538125 RepID=A0AAV4QCM9_9ARAC|nr:substance-P receptor [Caerostris darwini]
MFPLHVRITKQRTSIVMQVIWIVSILVSVPFLIFKRLQVHQWLDFVEPICREIWPALHYYDEEKGYCLTIEQYRLTYYIVVSIALYFIPIIIMITAYSLILWKLWISEVPGERHAANINVQYRARKKVIKMVLVVLIAFIICWTPIQVQIFLAVINSDKQRDSWTQEYQWISNYLAFANSFINPIIYGGFNKTFREGFCIMLRCGYRRDRFARNPRSRLTFTTGVTSSPSRYASKTINGANKNSSQKSSNMEMIPVFHHKDGDISPNMRDTCVTIADGKELL